MREAAPPGSRRSRPSAVARGPLTPYLFLLPALLVYGAFALYPLARAAQFSLFEWKGFGPSTFVGLANYADLVGDADFRAAIGNALVLIVFYAVIPLVVGLVLAAVLRRGQVRGMGFFRTVIFLPQVIALVVVAVAWRQIYSPSGLLNEGLRLVGLEVLTRGWLGDPGTALAAVGFIGTWVEMGLVMLLMLSGMSRIPAELFEAARLDGAGPVREFFAITLPHGARRDHCGAGADDHRGAEDLRPGLPHHLWRARQLHHGAELRGLLPSLRPARGGLRLRGGDRADGADLRDQRGRDPHRGA